MAFFDWEVETAILADIYARLELRYQAAVPGGRTHAIVVPVVAVSLNDTVLDIVVPSDVVPWV